MISCKALDTRRIKILVLDEVDTMLSRGFEEQVYRVIHTQFIAATNQNCYWNKDAIYHEVLIALDLGYQQV